MDLTTALLLAFAVSFIVAGIDYFTDIGFFRAVVALLLSSLGCALMGLPFFPGVILALASAFLAMSMLTGIERVNYRPGRLR
jgi:hypothetical protein